jgi:predicted MFS family arabinose efflux permease
LEGHPALELSVIVELVPRDNLVNAVTLSSVSVALSRALGAALGELLVAAVGLAFCFAVNAFSCLAVIASLAAVRTAHLGTADRVLRAKGQIREGVRYARKTPRSWYRC